jgi:hypothetical protein
MSLYGLTMSSNEAVSIVFRSQNVIGEHIILTASGVPFLGWRAPR